jgi:DNA-binding NarL/FixJ family response regulator
LKTIVLVDRQSVFRHGLQRLIEANFTQLRVENATSLDEPVVLEASFDVMLIDEFSLDHNGRAIFQAIKAMNPKAIIAVMSHSQARSDVFSFLSAGFHGFLCKRQPEAQMLIGLGDLLSGKIHVPRWIVDDAPSYPAAPRFDLPRLTRRQREILPLIAAGMSTKEIARQLNISSGTTKIHTTALMRALGARNRTEAAFLAGKAMRSGFSQSNVATNAARNGLRATPLFPGPSSPLKGD